MYRNDPLVKNKIKKNFIGLLNIMQLFHNYIGNFFKLFMTF